MVQAKTARMTAILLAALLLLSLFPVLRAQAAIGTTFGQPVDLAQPIKSVSSFAIYDSVVG